MANAEAVTTASDRITEMVGRLQRQEGFDEVVAALKAGHAATLDGVWGSSCALVAAALAAHGLAPIVIVCPRADDADDFADDFQFFSPLVPERFPARGSAPGDRVIHDEIFGDRVRLLKLWAALNRPAWCWPASRA